MKTILLVILILVSVNSYCQLYITKTGYISFFSKTPLEDIKAYNNQVYAVIDVEKKNLAFTLLMKGFLFTRQLQQDHFNENYIESDRYPKASFSGSYIGFPVMNKDGSYAVTVKGDLTIHGITKPLESAATMEVKAGRLLGNCSFDIKPENYNIIIPSLVRDKIAKKVTVTVQIDCSQH